jgi:hypothetical protein
MLVMKHVRNVILYLLALGLPIFFLPGVFADAFGVAKYVFLLTGLIILLLLWGYQVFERNSVKWRSTPFDIPILLIGGAYLLSTLIASPNKVGALASPAGSGVVLTLILIYFLVVQTYKPKTKPLFSWTTTIAGLSHSAVLLSLWTLINLLMELGNFNFSAGGGPASMGGSPLGWQFPLTNLSLTGNLLTQAILLLLILIYLTQRVMRNQKNVPNVIYSFIILAGLLATSYKLVALSPFPLLPYRFGWSIGVDAFKNSPVFGIGPENYVSAFTRFKPIAINQTDYWNVTFGLSSNHYLHLLTTVGLLGLITYLLLVLKTYRLYIKDKVSYKELKLTILAIFAIQLFVPFNLPLLFVQFILLAILGTALSGTVKTVKVVTVKEEEL